MGHEEDTAHREVELIASQLENNSKHGIRIPSRCLTEHVDIIVVVFYQLHALPAPHAWLSNAQYRGRT